MKRSILTGMICFGAMVLTLCAVFIGAGAHRAQDRAVFRDVAVELGTQTLSIEAFLADPAHRGGVAFVSDVRSIDLGTPGSTPVTLRRGKKLQTVTLTVQDTTAPSVTFKSQVTVPLGSTPRPEDFIDFVEDSSETTAAFAAAPASSEDYSDQQVTITVTDAFGNETTGHATLRIDWINPQVTLELGTKLTKAHILLDPEKDDALITQEAINEINLGGAGKYTMTVQSGSSIRSCSITIQDTLPPELVLKEVSLLPSWTCTMDSFIVSATDAGGDVELKLLSELPFGQRGDHPVKIQATDKSGHTVIGETKLRIHDDITPPTIYGMYDMNLTTNQSAPDYDSKVSAYDQVDGKVAYTYDDSGVDLTRAGIYYVTYTAADTTGNVVTRQRKVVIKPDYKDTEKLVADIAASLEKTDPESIRDFVRNNIVYTPNWGGDDPVAYGFTNWYGNCYVHALCLQALLDYYGYENELIWVTNKTHYWLIINLDGTWYHIDATPGNTHTRYSLMTNEQRLATLRGRRWDTTKWPQMNQEK